MAPYDIRVFGDPVLVTPARDVTEIDGDLVRLADDMLETMYEAPGVGLAAPQIGVQKRIFVYDIGQGPGVVVNPRITERDGGWEYEEGCLSVPGMSWPITRSARVHLSGWDLDGNELSVDADELLARVFQHETDHLDGVLLLERLDKSQRRQALRTLRNRAIGLSLEDSRPGPGLRGPNATPGLRGPNATTAGRD
ncbi:MAG TPA: peptide deformylase [Acidimicrobiales bacterium]|nr:peptide deformylase [Acidimicrobiales bacterium]